MFPAPTTIATSTPRSWTCLIWPATAATRSGSVPYSSAPMRASPESLSRTLWKTALLTDGEPREAPDHHVLAGLGREVGAEVLDRLAVVLLAVDVRLLEQHHVVEPL